MHNNNMQLQTQKLPITINNEKAKWDIKWNSIPTHLKFILRLAVSFVELMLVLLLAESSFSSLSYF